MTFILIVVCSFLKAVISLRKKTINNMEERILKSTLLSVDRKTDGTRNIIFLKSEFSFLGEKNIDDVAEEKEQEQEQEHSIKEENISTTKEFYTQKISNTKYRVGSVCINSYIGNDLDLEELSKPFEVLTVNPCNVLLYHTHTSESYTIDNEKYSDYYRTENDEYNVVAVGKFLSEELQEKGFNVTHNKTKRYSS